MKHLFIFLLLVLHVSAQNNITPDYFDDRGPGCHPIVPEPSTYGAILLISMVGIFCYLKRKRN